MLRGEEPWVWGFLTCAGGGALVGVVGGWGGSGGEGEQQGPGRGPYFYLEEVLWRAVDLFEGLVTGLWH